MKVLTPEEVAKVYEVTDSLGLNRNWVVLPVASADEPEGAVVIMPDGKVLLRAPGGPRFTAWHAGLKRRLEDLDLSRTPRSTQHEPSRVVISPSAPPGSGSRRYLNWEPGTRNS